MECGTTVVLRIKGHIYLVLSHWSSTTTVVLPRAYERLEKSYQSSTKIMSKNLSTVVQKKEHFIVRLDVDFFTQVL